MYAYYYLLTYRYREWLKILKNTNYLAARLTLAVLTKKTASTDLNRHIAIEIRYYYCYHYAAKNA